ncbi:MAG TPA: type II toxin-antitoxin system prevent-host-death family antitoxin [Caulobacteraceae bacterium]|jgi:prevent-host-death family protein|nr:type II toxin-antitoxin system prevent-host-death family antitoxin [Caulobacteraceae bacterium]
MKQVNLYIAKTDLSSLVEQAAAGEEIIIAKNGKPKAKLVALDAITTAPKRKREFGFWNHYGWKLPADFDDPDPELEALFYDGPIFPDEAK